jgi:Cu-Zn family superoxide dismutase
VRKADGTEVGTLRLEQTATGVRMSGTLTGLPAGAHGIHFHAVGRCDAPDFSTAGPHFNPRSTRHGLANPQGPHAGDLPAIAADATGRAAVEATSALVTLDGSATGLLDADGTAIVVHAGNDDQRTDPSGNSGGRVACGVIQRL